MADKRIRKLIQEVEAQGWRVEDRNSRYVCYSPDGHTIVSIHRTPSDHRWYENTIRELRKGGFTR